MSSQGTAFDYSSPAELFLSKRTQRQPNTVVLRQRLRPFVMLSKSCAQLGPSAPGCRSVMSGFTLSGQTK